MKIAICEDIKPEAEWLCSVIQKWTSKKEIIAEISLFEDAAGFSFALEDTVFDVLFLDIKMPGEDGVALAKRLRKNSYDMAIVFVTGEKEYILEGYEVDAVNYLIKPVDENKVYQCLSKIYDNLRKTDPYIILETENGIVKILQKDIYSVEVYGHKLVYTTKSGQYETTSSLKESKKALVEKWFVNSHRSILVNLLYIEIIEKNKVFLLDEKNNFKMEYPVSRRCHAEMNQAFISYHKNNF